MIFIYDQPCVLSALTYSFCIDIFTIQNAVVPTYPYELRLVEGSIRGNTQLTCLLLVDGWDKAKPAAFVITVTSPLTPVTLNEASINEGEAALAADTRKHAAH